MERFMHNTWDTPPHNTDTDPNPELKEEQKASIKISDKFWEGLMEEMEISIEDEVDNIGFLDVVFNSNRKEIAEAQKRRTHATGEERIVGKYFIDDESIHFSHPREKFNPRDLVASVVHELIHYVQDVTNKYPDIRNPKELMRQGDNAPWEKEAYALMYELVDNFIEECEFYWNDGTDMDFEELKTQAA